MTPTRALHLVGAASSAAAYGPGQERAPEAFRRHGLVTALEGCGRTVTDIGNVAQEVFRPDPCHPDAANVDTVVQVCRAVARPVSEALSRGVPVLILGGDCTVVLGAVAGALEGSDNVGLVYLDGDTDLNTPETGDGILDWMGVAHLLDVPGSRPELSTFARRSPMLEPPALRFVAAENITDAERELVNDLGLRLHPLAECLADPPSLIRSLREWSKDFDRLLVHVDVDVLDGSAFPIADNTRQVPGLSLTVLSQLLEGLCHLPNFAVLTLCEVNPDHASNVDTQLTDLIAALVTALR